jgi:hypothetical protein
VNVADVVGGGTAGQGTVSEEAEVSSTGGHDDDAQAGGRSSDTTAIIDFSSDAPGDEQQPVTDAANKSFENATEGALGTKENNGSFSGKF